MEVTVEDILKNSGIADDDIPAVKRILRREAGKRGMTIMGYLGVDPEDYVSEKPAKPKPEPKPEPREYKKVVLPDMSRSDMLQHVGWRAAKAGKSIQEFRQEQYQKNYERQKKQRAIVRKLMQKCPSWHRWELIDDSGEFEIYYCKQDKEHRAIRYGEKPSGTVIDHE